jgi:hypothetical protein
LRWVVEAKKRFGLSVLDYSIVILSGDGRDALRESCEAYSGQFDTENEGLRPENTLPWERIAAVAAT